MILVLAKDARLEAITTPLAEVSSILSGTAGDLADHAVPVGLEADDPSLDVPVAVSRGLPLNLPESGVPAAIALSDSAAPVARAAPVASNALASFAPV